MSDQLAIQALWAINGIAAIFIIGNLTRSVILKKGFSRITWRAYLAVVLFTIIADLAISKAMAPEALTALLGAVIGGSVGKDSLVSKDEDEK